MTVTPSQFWDDLASDVEDPELLREYVRESVRIATVDNLVNELDEARQTAGLTKAELARAISAEPAVVRRLFSAGHVNPTVGTLAAVAAVLGMRLTLEPLPDSERERITRPLIEGRVADPEALAKHASEMRDRTRAALAS
jgi:transcriptional regulator with XRE-family HTH domain